MLRLVDHAVELIYTLNEVVDADLGLSEEYEQYTQHTQHKRIQGNCTTHQDILQLLNFVRKHSEQLERRGLDTRGYNLVTLLAGSKPIDNKEHKFSLDKSREYDANMDKIKDQLDRNAYLSMVGSSLLPLDEQQPKPKSEYKQTKDELQVVTSVIASMLAIATAIWWAGGSINPIYKTLFAFLGAIFIALVEASLYIIIQGRQNWLGIFPSAFPRTSTSSASFKEADQLRGNVPIAQHTGPFGMEAIKTEIGRVGPSAGPAAAAWSSEFGTLNYRDKQRDVLERSFNQRHMNQSNWNDEFAQQQQQQRGSRGDSASPSSLGHSTTSPYSTYSPYMPISPSLQSTNTSQHTQPINPINQEEEQAKWDQQFDRLYEDISSKAASQQTHQQSTSKDDDIQQQFKQALRDEGLDVDKNENYLSEFENVWNTQTQAHHEDEFNKNLAGWEREFNMEMNSTRESIENDLIEQQNNSAPVSQQEYQFETANHLLDTSDPFAEGQRLLREGGPLSEPALAFEAAAQQTPHNAKAWLWLGYTHAMDEKEEAAIRALERCLREDSNEIEAMIPLAISYTNEGDDNAATLTLERWLSKKYPHTLTPDTGTSTNSTWPWATHQRVIDCFLDVARSQFSSADKLTLDADVQVGLGVLSYATSNYDQAEDCFKTALSLRPDDWLLWNRLGATLANGGNSESAIEAYEKALELRPTFTRAIHNLGVSCLNIGCYKEATEHLLGAIALQQATNDNSINESHSLWQTLRRALFAIDRHDLANIARPGTAISRFFVLSSQIDAQHWSTFISPSMAATLEISHAERDGREGEKGRLTVCITHESGSVDTMVKSKLGVLNAPLNESQETVEIGTASPKVIFKENIVMVKHSDGRFQITFTTNASAMEFVGRIRRLGVDCVAANDTIPLLRCENGKKENLNRLNSMSGVPSASQSSTFMPPPTQLQTQTQLQLSQSLRHSQTGFSAPSPSQKRRRCNLVDSGTTFREMEGADNVNVNVENDELLTESILRVVREPDFVRLVGIVEKLRTINALKLDESFAKHN
ncbi:hypothetical protein E3P77_01937 [Wallemia ichthyophaga]|nr:hypothetical protein E3P77_01937 [Wallemia ichthyophaga]